MHAITVVYHFVSTAFHESIVILKLYEQRDSVQREHYLFFRILAVSFMIYMDKRTCFFIVGNMLCIFYVKVEHYLSVSFHDRICSYLPCENYIVSFSFDSFVIL